MMQFVSSATRLFKSITYEQAEQIIKESSQREYNPDKVKHGYMVAVVLGPKY